MKTLHPIDKLPDELLAALKRQDVEPTPEAMVEAITAREWFMSIGITYRDPLPFQPVRGVRILHWADVWIGAHVAPDVSGHGQATSVTEALGWALVQTLGEEVSEDIDAEGNYTRWVRR